MENYLELHENKKARMEVSKKLHRDRYDLYKKALSQMGYEYDEILKIVTHVDYLIEEFDNRPELIGTWREPCYNCQNPFLIKGITKILEMENRKYVIETTELKSVSKTYYELKLIKS